MQWHGDVAENVAGIVQRRSVMAEFSSMEMAGRRGDAVAAGEGGMPPSQQADTSCIHAGGPGFVHGCLPTCLVIRHAIATIHSNPPRVPAAAVYLPEAINRSNRRVPTSVTEPNNSPCSNPPSP